MKIGQTAGILSLTPPDVRGEPRQNKDFLACLDALGGGQTATSSPAGGIAHLGLLGWVQYESRRQAEETARAEVMQRWGLEGPEDVEALSDEDLKRFEAEVEAMTEEKLAQALKEGALEAMREKESVLYRNTPLPEEDDGNIAF